LDNVREWFNFISPEDGKEWQGRGEIREDGRKEWQMRSEG
jgi:hypothetical protein